MTKQQLENYIHLSGEIADLKRERARLEKKLHQTIKITVQGSSPEYPYTLHPITINGRDNKSEEKLKSKISEIRKKEELLAAEEKAIVLWLDNIPQNRIRRMMRYRYIDKLSWVRIAMMLKYDSADAARMAHNRFIERNL